MIRAIWQKYPNPFASHVLTSDVVDRYIDNQGILSITFLYSYIFHRNTAYNKNIPEKG